MHTAASDVFNFSMPTSPLIYQKQCQGGANFSLDGCRNSTLWEICEEAYSRVIRKNTEAHRIQKEAQGVEGQQLETGKGCPAETHCVSPWHSPAARWSPLISLTCVRQWRIALYFETRCVLITASLCACLIVPEQYDRVTRASWIITSIKILRTGPSLSANQTD